ncbi:hypothetical protein PAP_03300 [Palaeococcus pacificus DY20341]|uniref:Transcription regulator PadR N-terminal domain-containing protein n=1 Tax=Palaeococcus pacificus DY20341 TaxID=1343739 RepID=A0A075LQU1_9EURY|nr:PadR family transcriptional regulator [Palaeococcus pacificus]AIF69080.1 hypothetical protein PAP_03300 [Palaeococcus pacificus DY20341]
MSSKASVMRNMFTVPMRNMILLIIALKGKAHGYEIIKEIENITSGVWKPSYGNLYPMLNKMVEEGFIEPHEEYRGKRRLVKYSLTDKGWTCLKEANEIALRGLYMAVQYLIMLREKLDTMGYGREIETEILEEYLKLLENIRETLNTQIEALEKKLEERRKELKSNP